LATEISNGRPTVKLYRLVNRGKAMDQLLIIWEVSGQKNFADRSEVRGLAKEKFLVRLTNDAEAVEAIAQELESNRVVLLQVENDVTDVDPY
jgi:hypothetical protein